MDKAREVARNWAERGRQVHSRIPQIRGRAISRNGDVVVIVDARGRVADVRMTPQALNQGEVRLGQILTETLQHAHDDAARQVEEAWQSVSADPAVKDILDFGRQITCAEHPATQQVNVDYLSYEEETALHQESIARQFRGK